MMIPSRYAGRVILLAVVAISLAAFSLTMPWYEHDGVYWIRFGPGYYGAEEYPTFKGLSDPVGSVMAGVMLLVTGWCVAAVAFIGFILIDGRWGSVITGAMLILVSAAVVVHFFFNMPAALGLSGFVGRDDHGSYGPLSAFWILAFACVIQLSAVVVRLWTVAPRLRKIERIPSVD